ncbi:hypothetical protein HMPREF1868_00468 [Olsenella sp. DNF00959]|nr:hypothetical protein HMPREF1868_00468 [Olsenella sp. DNF00959]
MRKATCANDYHGDNVMLFNLLLAIVLLIEFWLCLTKSDFELLSPAPLNTLVFCLAAALSILGMRTWNEVPLKVDGFSFLLLGCTCFALGALLVRAFWQTRNPRGRHYARPGSLDSHHTHSFEVASWKYLVLFVVVIAAAAIRIHDMTEMAAGAGKHFESYVDLAKWARQVTSSSFSTSNIRMGEGFSLVSRQADKLVTVIAYCSVFFSVRSIADARGWKGIVPPLSCLLATCGYTILMGSRGPIANYAFASALAFFLLQLRDGRSARLITKKMITIGGIAVLLGIPLFYFSSALVGRMASSSLDSYISFYVSGGLPSFQLALDRGIAASPYPGMRSFYNLYVFAYKFGIIHSLQPYASDFVRIGNHDSNIYTMFFRYFADFGIAGIIVLGTAAGGIFEAMYEYARRHTIPAVVVPFLYVGSNLFDLEREEYVFSRMLNTSVLVIVVLAVIVTLWLTGSLGTYILQLRRHMRGALRREDALDDI